MTDLLDWPTEERTDLLSERWEVETAVPMAITGEVPLGDADFVLMSHAEKALGDFPMEFGNGQQLFDDLAAFARNEVGLLQVTEGLLFNQGELVFSNVHNTSGVPTAIQALHGLLAGFVGDGTGIRRMAQRSIVEDVIERFPVPVFGSPPSDFSSIGQMIGTAPCTVLTGIGAWNQSPVLVSVGLGTTLVICFLKPSAQVLRRSMGERFARKLGTEYRGEDEQ